MNRALVCFAVLISASVAFGADVKGTRPAITGVSHVTLYADDLGKSRSFYTELLGWEQVPSGEPVAGVRFYANHLQYVELMPAPRPGMMDRLACVGFSVKSAEGMRSFLEANGVAVPKRVSVDRLGDRWFEVKDPEGNRVAFSEQGPHPPKGETAVKTRLSTHIIHAGMAVQDRAKLDKFYKELLGFHLYWQGGNSAAHTDWVMMQVPDGTDWLEYMLYITPNSSRSEVGGANHFAPGVASAAEVEKALRQRGWTPQKDDWGPLLGLDGKWQLDLRDPDGTRVEFMEFKAVKEPCCSAVTGPLPEPWTGW